MAPTTATKQQLVQSLPPPPPPPCSGVSSSSQDDDDDDDDDDGDVVRQLVMGRWRSSLSSGLRAALACTIVGLVSLYAPAALCRHITFPAFSYVVTVILVTDATLGTALRGAVSALHGTLMGAAPSVAALWLAHCTGAAESVVATSAVVALTAFAVALPESVGPVAKRIALGQAIIIYVARFQQGERPSRALALLHPANVVACTALLAVLIPWPRLATREARDKSRAYKVVATERVRVLADAFIGVGVGVGVEAEACSRHRRWQMAACMSEANRLASASATLLNRMNAIKYVLPTCGLMHACRRICSGSSIEMPLTGMQIALTMMQQASGGGHGNNKENMVVGLVMGMRDQIRLALLTPNKPRQQSRSLLFGSSCSTATATASSSKSLCYLPTPTTNYDYDEQQQKQQLAPFLFILSLYQLHRRCCGDGSETPLTAEAAAMPNAKQVAPATTTTGQELLLEQPADLLLPDDEQEEVEQQVGQDDPSSQAEAATATAGEEKATTRTTKHQQTRSRPISSPERGRRCRPGNSSPAASPRWLTAARLVAEPSSELLLKRVQQELALLRKHAAEAGSEPTYLWLPPFPAACYDKIQGSLSRMAQLLQLYHQARRHQQVDTNTIQQRCFSSLASTSLSHCLRMLEPRKEAKGQVVDLEAGTAAGGVGCSCCCSKDDEVVGSFLAQARELLLNDDDDDDDDDDSVEQQEERFLVVCCLGSIALCMGEILKEAQRLEAHILDLNNLQVTTGNTQGAASELKHGQVIKQQYHKFWELVRDLTDLCPG
ncbi:unnamed protein product [Miscanthus lutarioriparius]|uniref:Uncharacterized protein n=1 Tax=Miscanthus lutarioriparius TaxID=422564 RepID=A0A811R8U0_9POAL|nr:unnamed protein product [Miscanthus lutarioriparius]